MFRKISIFVVLMWLFMPLLSFAQSSGRAANSSESLSLQDIADDSIVMLSKEESGVSGYINAQYAYVHADCPGGVQVIHYSGPAFDPTDRDVLRNELRKCLQTTYDTSGDD